LAAQRREIAGSIERIERQLGRRPRCFCYPVGLPDTSTPATRECLRESRIELAFSDYGGYLPTGPRDPFDVRRTNVGHALSDARFAATLTLPQLFARGCGRGRAPAPRTTPISRADGPTPHHWGRRPTPTGRA
jgi:hypothetical protein